MKHTKVLELSEADHLKLEKGYHNYRIRCKSILLKSSGKSASEIAEIFDDNVYIPSEKTTRLNIFGMITRRNQYKGFRAQESINVDRLMDFLDRFS